MAKIKFPLVMNSSKQIYTSSEFKIKFKLNRFKTRDSIFLRPVARNDINLKTQHIIEGSLNLWCIHLNKSNFLKPVARSEKLYKANLTKRDIKLNPRWKFSNFSSSSNSFGSISYSSNSNSFIYGYGLELI